MPWDKHRKAALDNKLSMLLQNRHCIFIPCLHIIDNTINGLEEIWSRLCVHTHLHTWRGRQRENDRKERHGCLEASCRLSSLCFMSKLDSLGGERGLITAFSSSHFTSHLQRLRGERRIDGGKERRDQTERERRLRRGWRGDQVCGCVVNIFMHCVFTWAYNVCISSLWSCVGGFLLSSCEGQPFTSVCVPNVGVCMHILPSSVKPHRSLWNYCENSLCSKKKKRKKKVLCLVMF